MKVKINHDNQYGVAHLIKTFFKEVTFVLEGDSETIINSIEKNSEKVVVSASYHGKTYQETVQLTSDEQINKRLIKRSNARVLYDLSHEITGVENHYGTLVGVRPVKLVHEMFNKNYSDEEIDAVLYNEHRISKHKRALLLEIAKREKPFLLDADDTSKLSLYICIPFCPTRCLYCSFPSNDMRQKGKLVEMYFECLLREIDEAYKKIVTNHLEVDCIYIGGGTPSVLTEGQFEILLKKLDQYFDCATLKEFTVEAGRPDTITRDKLNVLKKYDVSRICVNPQSMNNKTLQLIGRDHETKDIIESYNLAKTVGFNSINMDLILGLPDETLEDVEKTLETIIALDPENITIHTLAVKVSSRLKETLDKYQMTQAELVEEMLKSTESVLRSNGYVPYYMYRQKNMVGNFENIGYCKEGYESLYNIRIIEEKHSILALGAGAVSKKCYPKKDLFHRIANVKGIEDYISRIDEVIEKEASFFEI
ncbi:MAG: coproporphyrinogen dehydrogenase HemZ [Clostridiales bacterium]|nr:coproporphyrinogen dehydrogenase HemZ [Clostridiales bacterium]